MIIKKLENFVDAIERAQKYFERESYRMSCCHAVNMAKLAKGKIQQGDEALNELAALSRYVSDSLPWNDEILKAWEAIQKIIDKKST